MRFIEVITRDGTVLRGLHYTPASFGPKRVILVLTPYGADRYHRDGRYFASRGYHFVSIDSRGRGDSDGHFVPFENDGADGNDAIAWLAEQTWSAGGIVTYGASYSGFVQWAIAATQPPALRAIAPVASVFPGVDFPAVGGLPTAYAVQWLTFVRGRRLNTGPLTDDTYWREVHRNLGDRPFRNLDIASVGEHLPAFQEWLNHPTYDAYWARLLPPAPVDVPVLAITGQYDDDQLGTLTYNARHPATHLVMGPWDHAGTRTAARSFGGLEFAADSTIDLTALHAEWYDWVLGLGPRPDFLADRVTYFHIGQGWRHAPSLPQGPPVRLDLPETTLHLDPALVGDEPTSYDEELADDAFTLIAPAHDVSGRPSVALTLSSEDLPDYDLLVQLYLLPADQDHATLLAETPLRARHHDLTRPMELTLPFISRTTGPGDRFALRVRAPHRRYETNRTARGEVRLGMESYVSIPGTGP